jgi:hypothetical protein
MRSLMEMAGAHGHGPMPDGDGGTPFLLLFLQCFPNRPWHLGEVEDQMRMKSVENRIRSMCCGNPGRMVLSWMTVQLVVKFSRYCDNFSVISSYELRFRCSSARWIYMDEGYKITVLDLYYLAMEKLDSFHH